MKNLDNQKQSSNGAFQLELDDNFYTNRKLVEATTPRHRTIAFFDTSLDKIKAGLSAQIKRFYEHPNRASGLSRNLRITFRTFRKQIQLVDELDIAYQKRFGESISNYFAQYLTNPNAPIEIPSDIVPSESEIEALNLPNFERECIQTLPRLLQNRLYHAFKMNTSPKAAGIIAENKDLQLHSEIDIVCLCKQGMALKQYMDILGNIVHAAIIAGSK